MSASGDDGTWVFAVVIIAFWCALMFFLIDLRLDDADDRLDAVETQVAAR